MTIQQRLTWEQEWINLKIEHGMPINVVLLTDTTAGKRITLYHYIVLTSFEEYCKYKTNALTAQLIQQALKSNP